MLALRGYYVLFRSLNSWRTSQTTCPLFRCCHARPVPPRHRTVFFCGPITARRGLLSSQDQSIYHILSATDRYKNLLSCYRQLSTSSKICCNVGKIESTHYHLIYTCKVSVLVLAYVFQVLTKFLAKTLCVFVWRRFALPGPCRRSPS